MNRIQTKHVLAQMKHAVEMQAYVDGETIQYKNRDDRWSDVQSEPTWNPGDKYRVKPKPVERFVIVGEKAEFVGGGVYGSLTSAQYVQKSVKGDYGPYKVYKLVEAGD
jgi:hypothetical protein